MVEPYKTPTQTTTSRTTSTSYTKTKIPFSTITKGPTPVNAPGPQGKWWTRRKIKLCGSSDIPFPRRSFQTQDWVGAHNRRRTNATYGGPVPEVLWSNYLAKEAEGWLACFLCLWSYTEIALTTSPSSLISKTGSCTW